MAEGSDEDVYLAPYECTTCRVTRPADEGTQGALPADLRLSCYGRCRADTHHLRVSKTREFKPTYIEAECPECGYSTVLYPTATYTDEDDVDERLRPPCPVCTMDAEYIALDPGNVGDEKLYPVEQLTNLTLIDGINEDAERELNEAGIETVADLIEVPESDLGCFETVGFIGASRIVSDLGKRLSRARHTSELTWTNVEQAWADVL